MRMNFRRFNIISLPEIQYAFVGYGLFFALVVVTGFYACTEYFFQQMRLKGVSMGLDEQHPFFQLISTQRDLFLPLAFTTIIALSIVMIFVGFFISHKIAGPIKKIESHLDNEIAVKNGEPIVLRRKDYFRDLAAKVNLLLERAKN